MSGWTSWGGEGWDGDGEEDDEDGPRDYVAVKDQLILLVDATQTMFRRVNDEIPFQLCMKCAKSVLLNKIVSSDKDLVSIVFFGTDKDKNRNDFKHIYVFQDMEVPDAPRIKAIEEILSDDGFSDFKTTYGHSNDFSLSDALWTCSSILATSGSKHSHKRILLFTSTERPHSSNTSLERQAKTKAKDLAENGIEIELMHLGSSFDVSLFYQDIIVTGDEDLTLPNPSEKFDELLTRVRSKEFKKRAMQRLTLSLGPGLELGVGVYCLVREAKKPSFVRLDKSSNEELRTNTKSICEDTGTELMPQDIKYYQQFGGEKIVFEKEETVEIKKLGTKGLTLLGFKPRSEFKRHYYVKPASFIYPDETTVVGSSKLFSALLTRCLAREVIAICQFTPTANAGPRIVALMPQEEEFDENNVQVSPPGFHVLFLPFADELRKVKYDETTSSVRASADPIDKAKEVIKKLTFNFLSDSFENPVLQKHYRYLEAIALEHENVEDFSDLTEPDREMIARRAGPLLDQFTSMVYPEGYDPDKKPTAKRKATGVAAGRPAKVPKVSSCDADVPTLAKDGKLNSLKVQDLKAYLKTEGLPVAGKKQDLIDAITNHLGL